MSAPSEIVALLKEASAAYYNGGPLKMDDDTFDALQDKLRELDPDNPYLSTVGAPPTGDVVKLPYAMPSLDKIKPGQDALRRFLSANKTLLLSEKLDGLSAMWIPDRGALYLRGNGKEGQDVSHLVPLGIQGLVKAGGSVIRGELVVPRSTVSVLPRSWVNGIIHRKDPDPVDVSKIRFVAYDLLSPANKTRAQAFQWLRAVGFELPWNTVSAGTTEDSLKAVLLQRRKDSPYDTDGIVAAIDAVPQRPKDFKNPKDAVAFKMPLADQSAETTVRAVLWAPSAQGYLIPKIEFDPVVIGSATIQFASAHNAKLVETSGLGPGARVVIRRSGDVIPTIDRVLSAAKEPQMPLKGSYEWASDVHIRQIGDSKEQIAAKLQHFLKTLEIPGAGPATAVALVEAGITGPKKLLLASPDTLGSLLGPKTGATLYKSLRAALAAASELQLMIASSTLPRGVGESKLKILFEAEPDPKRWTPESRPGWTQVSLATFLEQLPTYFKWREEELGAPYGGPKAPVKPAVGTAKPEKREVFCMTGFRDKALEASLIAAGHTVSATLTGKVTVLLVADGERKESEKTKAAAAKGIPILSASVAKAKYLS
jgi:DNA ligase (NAD+)